MLATPEPSWAAQNPLGGILRYQASRFSGPRIAPRPFSAPGSAPVSAVAHRIPQRRLPPHGIRWLPRESDDVAFSRSRPASSWRRAQVCTLPLSHSGWDSAPRPPPLQHRVPIPLRPVTITRNLCCLAPSGLLRGLPGVSFGRAFLPRGELLRRSLSTSRFLRSGMSLSERSRPVHRRAISCLAASRT